MQLTKPTSQLLLQKRHQSSRETELNASSAPIATSTGQPGRATRVLHFPPAPDCTCYRQALRSVSINQRPSGVLVYSTCSLEPEENEELVWRVLAGLSMLQLERTKHSIPFRDYFDGAFA